MLLENRTFEGLKAEGVKFVAFEYANTYGQTYLVEHFSVTESNRSNIQRILSTGQQCKEVALDEAAQVFKTRNDNDRFHQRRVYYFDGAESFFLNPEPTGAKKATEKKKEPVPVAEPVAPAPLPA